MPLSQLPDAQDIAQKVAYGFWSTLGIASMWGIISLIKRLKLVTMKTMQDYINSELNKFQEKILTKLEEKLAENTLSCSTLQVTINEVKSELGNVSARVDKLIDHLIK